MVQILPQQDLGEDIGSGLGQGISSGLQMLLANKLKGMQMEKEAELKERGQKAKFEQLMSLLGAGGGEEEVMVGEEVSSPGARGAKELTDRDILSVSLLDPNLGKLLQSQKGAASQETASRYKETKDTRKDIIKGATAARENNMRLNRMAKLNEAGNLIPGLFNQTLKRLGVDYAALKNPESQEFEKLSTDMLRNAKEIFGARVTNFEMDAFLKSIPTLNQTEEGRRRVIRNLKIFNEGALARSNAMKQILKENKGVPPYDLDVQIEERVGPQLDGMMEEFTQGAAPTTGMKEMPDPSTVKKGRILVDQQTGKRFRNSGVEWEEIIS